MDEMNLKLAINSQSPHFLNHCLTDGIESKNPQHIHRYTEDFICKK